MEALWNLVSPGDEAGGPRDSTLETPSSCRRPTRQEANPMTIWKRRLARALVPAIVLPAALWMGAGRPAAQSVAAKETVFNVERALERLPYYGVFDFLAFGVDRGTVTLQGYAYHGSLKSAATNAVKRVSGVDEVT